MIPTLSPLRSAAAFYLLAFAMVVGVAPTGRTTAAAMVTPAVATVMVLLLVTREGWTRRGWAPLGVHRLGLRSWPVAIPLPLLIVLAGAALVISTDAARWQFPGGRPAATRPGHCRPFCSPTSPR